MKGESQKYLRYNLTAQLDREVQRIASIRNDRNTCKTVGFYLRVMLRVAQSNPRLEFVHKTVDHSPLLDDRDRVSVSDEELEYVKVCSEALDLSQNMFVNRTLWYGFELHKSIDRRMCPKSEEELIKLMNRELRLRNSMIN
jgi:hypothetical protein